MAAEIHFSPSEAKILQHRLDQPDCMAEMFGPDNENQWPELTTQDEVEDFITQMLGNIVTYKPNGGMIFTIEPSNPDHVEIVTEVVEGNTMGTYVGDLLGFYSDEPDYKKGAALKKHLTSIERKLESVGIMAEFAL